MSRNTRADDTDVFDRKVKRSRRAEEEDAPRRNPHVRRFSVNPKEGLSTAQVESRIRDGYQNLPVDPPSKSVSEIVRSNIFTYFNYIFLAMAVLLIIAGSWRDLTFLPIIIANTLIGIIQEIRSKKTLDKLNVLHAPRAMVIRNGRRETILAEALVLDDIAVFKAGAQIPADAVLVAGDAQVNESLITGESDEVSKKTGDMLLSGSFVVSGSCLARIEKVGEDAYASKLTTQARQMKEDYSCEMMKSLTKLVKWVGIIIIPIGTVLFLEQFMGAKDGFRASITSMVAAVIGMIPEGLYLLASVALVLSVLRLAQSKVLVHEMACIETLARVDVLCVDKTGTITENTMEADGFIPLPAYKEETMPPLQALLADFVYAMSADNTTMAALQNFFKETTGAQAKDVLPFSSVTKYSAATFGEATYVIGAPEFVLREKYQAYQARIEKEAGAGHRVLVFGRYHGSLQRGKPLTEAAEPYALVLLSNPIRDDAAETFGYFKAQGVDIKVISGDNPLTVSRVALRAGIPHAEDYIDARQLIRKEDYIKAVGAYTVFGRVTPEQKRLLVRALKEAGHTVAMTGDGVNDVLALKDADCSIAMASGSDAAAQAAQIVLLRSNFSCMPKVVLEGRRVVNNIQRSASLFLVKNIFSFLMALFSIFTFTAYPLSPSQISLVSMFTIGTPAFLLSLEPNKNRIRGKFLRNVLLAAMPAGLTNFLVVGAMVVFGNTFGVAAKDISTASTLLLAIVGVMILYRICKPFNAFRATVWAGMIVLLILAIGLAHNLFSISSVSLQCGMLLGAFAIITEPLFRYLTRLTEAVSKFTQSRQEQKLRRKFYGE